MGHATTWISPAYPGPRTFVADVDGPASTQLSENHPTATTAHDDESPTDQ